MGEHMIKTFKEMIDIAYISQHTYTTKTFHEKSLMSSIYDHILLCLSSSIEMTLIGCTILRAVSGMLRTHCGRRGSVLGRLPTGANAPGRSGPAGPDTSPSAFAPGLCGFSLGLCGFTLCPCGLPLSSGRRRALLTSHWPWVVCRAARRRGGSPARIATVVFAGVQRGGLRLVRLRVDRRHRRIV
jgi:hypothetical protein